MADAKKYLYVQAKGPKDTDFRDMMQLSGSSAAAAHTAAGKLQKKVKNHEVRVVSRTETRTLSNPTVVPAPVVKKPAAKPAAKPAVKKVVTADLTKVNATTKKAK